MAFTFQKNDDVRFIHDENFLQKAEECRPKLHYKTVRPTRLVEVVADETKLNGWGVVESEKDIQKLPEYGWKRDDRLILDFGEHCVGRFQMEIASVGSPMDAPLFLRLQFAEVPAELMAKPDEYDGWLSKSWIQEESIHLDELPATLSLPRRYSFRYVAVTVLDTSPKWQAVFLGPTVTTETAADFTAISQPAIGDALLKKIYEVGEKTLAECMQDVFEDGPKRDRRLWLGDLRLQALANYATFDNVALVKRCLYLFAGMTTEEGKIPANVFVRPRNVPDDTFLFEYSLFFISTLYDLHHAHEDVALVKELYPTCKKQMDITLKMVDENGRLHTDEEYPIFVDWSNDFDKETAGQAETIYVLKQFVALAEIAGEDDITHYRKRLDAMVHYAKTELYDEKRKLFVTAGKEYNIASQVWMVLAHIMDDEENHEILRAMQEELFPVRGIATPYMYHHIAEALLEGGWQDEAVQLIKSYWGRMIELGADTFWEAFEPERENYSPYGSPIVNSYCHAWSCTPVYLIQKYRLSM